MLKQHQRVSTGKEAARQQKMLATLQIKPFPVKNRGTVHFMEGFSDDGCIRERVFIPLLRVNDKTDISK